jgi:hypothetical protein
MPHHRLCRGSIQLPPTDRILLGLPFPEWELSSRRPNEIHVTPAVRYNSPPRARTRGNVGHGTSDDLSPAVTRTTYSLPSIRAIGQHGSALAPDAETNSQSLRVTDCSSRLSEPKLSRARDSLDVQTLRAIYRHESATSGGWMFLRGGAALRSRSRTHRKPNSPKVLPHVQAVCRPPGSMSVTCRTEPRALRAVAPGALREVPRAHRSTGL